VKSVAQTLEDEYIKRQIRLVRLASNNADEFAKNIRRLLLRLKAQLADSRYYSASGALEKTVSEIITAGVENIYGIVEPEKLAQLQVEFSIAAISGAVGAAVVTPSERVAALLKQPDSVIINGSPLRQYVNQYADALKVDVMREIRLGIAAGESMEKIAQRMTATIAGIKDSSARMFARTLTLGVTNAANAAVYEDNAHLVQGYVQSSVLDSRTTTLCAARDNLAWTQDKKPVGHNQVFAWPPIHPNCRSQMLPWLSKSDDLPADIKRKLSKTTRASLDGQIPASTSFEEWIEGKDEQFQREWFGAGRYELWKDGKISITDLVAPDGRKLRLDEL
jgi:SPP1 gp7 family putative phage head morphogenesis protein